MIPAAFISDLLTRIDIVEVVSQHVKLRKAGANLLGLCPFHNEKSGSFTVSPSKQFYHCFGCGAHGTAVGFLMEYAGVSFPEAVRDLAQSVGMVVPEEGPHSALSGSEPAAPKLGSLAAVMLQASNYYRAQLRLAPRAIAYLKGRGLTGEIAARFALGYAPDQWTNLAQAFEDYQDRTLIEAGLVIDRDEAGAKKHYDRFRDRIMFPIRNPKGQVIGFGGRILDQGEPKYLNSPETPLFQKGLELYGLFEGRRAIREAGFVIVVEGYMDVVALAQLGVPNAVATLGTACTAQHVQKLTRTTDRIVFSFDGDRAGQRAAWRALEASLPFAADDKAFCFLFLPEEHDPDSYIRTFGEAQFRAALEAAMPLSSFLLQGVTGTHALDSAEGRARALHEAKPLLMQLPAGMLRLQIVRELARLTQSSAAEVTALAGLQAAPAASRAAPRKVRRARPTPLEDQIIRLLLTHPSLVLSLDGRTRNLLTSLPLIAELLQTCERAGDKATLATMSSLLSSSQEAELFADLISQLLAAPEVEREGAELELAHAARKLRAQGIRQELDELARRGAHDAKALQQMRALMAEQKSLQSDPGID